MNPHFDAPGGMHPSSSFDNLALTNPRVYELRAGRQGRRGSEPFMMAPGSIQNSPMVRHDRPILSRQISRSAQNSPLMSRHARQFPPRNRSAADLGALPDFLPPGTPRQRRGSEHPDDVFLPPGTPRQRRGSEHPDEALASRPGSRRGSRDELADAKDNQRHQSSSGDNQNHADADAKPEATQSTPNDVAVKISSPVTSPPKKTCNVRSVLKYFCVLVFIAGICAIVYFIVLTVKKKDADKDPMTTLAPS